MKTDRWFTGFNPPPLNPGLRGGVSFGHFRLVDPRYYIMDLKVYGWELEIWYRYPHMNGIYLHFIGGRGLKNALRGILLRKFTVSWFGHFRPVDPRFFIMDLKAYGWELEIWYRPPHMNSISLNFGVWGGSKRNFT